MPNYFALFSGSDNKSHFKERVAKMTTEEPLGAYSEKFAVAEMRFREFKAGNVFPWHTAPQKQVIVYLSGEVKVEASDGETRIFKAGDVLFAVDLNGEGHQTTTLTPGRSLIITLKEKELSQDAAILTARL